MNLKPCPFCGEEAKIESRNSNYGLYAFVECKGCHAKGSEVFVSINVCAADEATKRWNERAEE